MNVTLLFMLALPVPGRAQRIEAVSLPVAQPQLAALAQAAAAARAVSLPTLPALALPAPTLAAPLAPTVGLPLAAAPQVEAAFARGSARIAALADAAAPHIAQALSGAGTDESSEQAAERMLSPLAAAAAATPAARSAPAPRVGAPAVRGVVFDASVSPEHRSLLEESLRRRKAGWFRGLAAAGVRLDGPAPPAITVRSAQASRPGAAKPSVSFIVDWSRGETDIGSFKAVIPLKNVEPAIYRMPAPPAPEERQIVVRFREGTPEAEIARWMEANRLRPLGRGWDGTVRAAVTGSADAERFAGEVSGAGIVLYARAAKLEAAEGDRIVVAFVDGAAEDTIARALKDNGLRVLELKDGRFHAVPAHGTSAVQAAARLGSAPGVLYAAPLKTNIPESRQAVVRLREGDEAVAAALRAHRLTVLSDLGDRTFKVAGPEGRSGSELAAALAREAAVKEAVAVGSVPDAQVQSMSRGTISHKGRPWSQTEYNMVYGMGEHYLEVAGATEAQLKAYRDACDAAPVGPGGFNPWSGD